VDAYVGVGSPSTLQHRYVLEDIPTGLVPISYFGKIAGVQTPAMDSIVELACQLYGIDFWAVGRNPHSLGLVGMTIDEIKEYVAGGFRFSDEMSADEPIDVYEMEENRW
jgi:opine dehydrogenase